jgi:hypothetical protein
MHYFLADSSHTGMDVAHCAAGVSDLVVGILGSCLVCGQCSASRALLVMHTDPPHGSFWGSLVIPY